MHSAPRYGDGGHNSGVGRILVWGRIEAPRGRFGAEGSGVWGAGVSLPARGGGCAPSPENFCLFNLEMAHFDAHIRYSDVLILKFCFAT